MAFKSEAREPVIEQFVEFSWSEGDGPEFIDHGDVRRQVVSGNMRFRWRDDVWVLDSTRYWSVKFKKDGTPGAVTAEGYRQGSWIAQVADQIRPTSRIKVHS